MAKCDIIIPVWNQLYHTRQCIESIRKNTKLDYCLILIDNKSDSQTRDYLLKFSEENDRVILIRNEVNLGYIKACNQGLKISTSPYVCLMNNDTVATEGWLSKMVAILEKDQKVGLVNPRSEHPGRFSYEQYSKYIARYKGEYVETHQCMGFCMVIKKEVIDKIGYLDEVYGIGGFDDTDFSIRAHLAGYKCVCAKGVYVYHNWHTSFKKSGNREELVKRNERIFLEKWGSYLRIGYPIFFTGNSEDFYIDLKTAYWLAREWNWVHAWLNTKGNPEELFLSLRLPEHQALRIYNFSGIRPLFYMEVLFRLLERRLRKKKLFDVILVSDKKLLRFLSFFKFLFKTPLCYVERKRYLYGDTEELWQKRSIILFDYILKSSKGGVMDDDKSLLLKRNSVLRKMRNEETDEYQDVNTDRLKRWDYEL